MNVNARISFEWRRRMLILFLMFFGMAAWFLLDGYVNWPAEAERYEAFAEIRDELVEAGEAEDGESPTVLLAWKRYAEKEGLSSKVPKERTESAIREQRVIGWVLMVFAVGFGIWVLWNHRFSVRAEGETIIGASGQRVPLDSDRRDGPEKMEEEGDRLCDLRGERQTKAPDPRRP